MNKNMILKTYKEPTDIVIFGTSFEEEPETFSITDDESPFDIRDKNGSIINLVSDGFVTICEYGEFLTKLDLIDESCYFADVMLLKDYVGDITLSMINGKNKEIDITKFDLNEYLQAQHDDNGWCDVTISLNSEHGKLFNMEDFLWIKKI
jgi:hypothetical protein